MSHDLTLVAQAVLSRVYRKQIFVKSFDNLFLLVAEWENMVKKEKSAPQFSLFGTPWTVAYQAF